MVLLLGHYTSAQEKIFNEKGIVNYISNDNYYLRFNNTDNIQLGDTIYVKIKESKSISTDFSSVNFIPTFVVTFKSSTSILSTLLGEEKPAVKTEVFSFRVPIKMDGNPKDTSTVLTENKNTPISSSQSKGDSTDAKSVTSQEHVYGRFTLFDDYIVSNADSHISRMGARLNLGVKNIGNSRISFDSYISYQHYFRSKNPRNAPASFVGLYSLAFSYEGPKQFKASLGRAINVKLSSIGATDGIQLEKKFKKIYVGTVAGFRPSFKNYLMDFNLFQSGLYAGFEHTAALLQSQTTIGFIDQQNHGKTDRRYLAFQHSTSLRNNLTFFTSAEIDLFERLSNAQTSNKLKPTSLYLSLNYRLTKKISLFGSYDNRRNVTYYQTYFDILDELNAFNFVRQGMRFRVNFRITKSISLSGAYNTRMNRSEKSFDNLQGTLSFNRIPGIGGSFILSYNNNLTSYMKNQIYAARYNRNLSKFNGSFAFYLRVLHYKYLNISLDIPYQYYGGFELTKNFKKNYNFAFNVEYYKQKFHNTVRFNVRLSKTIK